MGGPVSWITPRGIAGALFTRRWFRGGYDEAEVDDFLDRVMLDVADMQEYIGVLEVENRSLRAEVMPDGAVPEPDAHTRPLVTSGGPPSLAGGPPDWRESMAAELAPEALAHNMPRPEAGIMQDYSASSESQDTPPRAGTTARAGPGHLPSGPGQPKPSPYQGQPAPAQRRRDRHKHRDQFAPGPLAWSVTDADAATDPHWKARGDYWHADWRVEWQDDVAAVDEEIAAWSERAHAWLAADPWDRSMRRLAVA